MLFLRVTRDIAVIDQYRYRDISSDCIYDVTHHFCDSEGKVDAETTQRWRASGIDSVSRPYAAVAISTLRGAAAAAGNGDEDVKVWRN